MKLGTRVKLAGIFTVGVFLVYGAALLYMDRTMSQLAREVQNANKFRNKISLLRTLSLDNLIYQTERSKKQWAAVYGEVRHLLDEAAYRRLQLEYSLGDIGDKVKIVGDTFQRLLAMPEPEGLTDSEAEIRRELRNRLTTQMLLTTQDLSNRFVNLSEEVHQDLIRTQRLISLLNILALLALGLIILSAGVFLQRLVLQPVLKLHAGAEIIGAGNLDYTVGMDSRDELGELSRAFDRMTANLQKVTVSRDELIREMNERQRVEAALRESEERLLLFIEHAPASLAMFDREMRYLSVSRRWRQDYGLGERDVRGLSHYEVFPEVPEKWQAAHRRGLAGEVVSSDADRFARLDGSVQWVRWELRPWYGGTGEVAGVVIFTEDITARRFAEEALQERSAELARAVADLEETNAEMERFTYMISHDLKSPLVTISTFLGFLEEDLERGDADRIGKDINYMRTAAEKMGQLLSELLEMSRIGRLVNPSQEVTFQELVREVLLAVAGPIAVRGVEVEVRAEDVTLFGDRPRLMEIWQNLVENAVKFMGEQERPRLTMGLERQEGETSFFVCDNGIGVEPKYQGKIFGIFEKLDSKSGGTGIGLAVVKRIVELYQGRIWVDSAGPGQGACFRFTLPGAIKSE
jgi:PAS domain S-box-containing protein